VDELVTFTNPHPDPNPRKLIYSNPNSNNNIDPNPQKLDHNFNIKFKINKT